MKQIAFQIDLRDNVATALQLLIAGEITLTGDVAGDREGRPYEGFVAIEEIPQGHKLALRDIAVGEMVIKYGVPIGVATRAIPAGSWVHLHCICSNYDERSSHLDVVTGAPKDVSYE